jgi:hypothetical protein
VAVIAAASNPASSPRLDPALSDSGTGTTPTGGGPSTDARLTIFRAQYRLTLKGPERGRWEVDVTAEADAPLATVDEVVRGVLRRAGDDEEPERLTADGLRAALSDRPWTATPR